jgi:N6-L-threonylcarbamoyladenine synthase
VESNSDYLLGIETSCDETACALVDREGRVKINSVASQIDLHARFGGVVPEVASRKHIETCLPLVTSTLRDAGVDWNRIGAIAVTQGPGLIGCLLIGVETAKALAWSRGKPLIAVHHLQAHLHAPYLQPEDPKAFHLLVHGGVDHKVVPLPPRNPAESEALVLQPEYPHVGLIVSGGHTSLVFVESPTGYRTIASTRDDAVGEAYDKVARILG